MPKGRPLHDRANVSCHGVYRRKSATAAVRKCLSCDKDFHSNGRHNRICPDCKHSNRVRDIHGGEMPIVPVIMSRGGPRGE